MRSNANSARPLRATKRTRWVNRPLQSKPIPVVRALDAVGQARVEEFVIVAYRVAWRFARTTRDVPMEELIAEALYGLTYASGLFDEARGVPFGAYAAVVIRHRLVQAIRNWRRAQRMLPVSGRRAIGDETIWDVADHGPTPDLSARASAREMCDRVRQVLPEQWYTVLHLFHAEGYSYTEIATAVGLSRQRISQVLKKAADRARQAFPDWAGPVASNETDHNIAG